MFKKVLVANRGEIAVRIMRACRELGIRSVGIYSDADKDSIAARYADESYPLGGNSPGDTYLNSKKIVEIAQQTGAEAVHPGYGFLSENPNFAWACEKAGVRFVGPHANVLQLSGNKIAARKVVSEAGIPVIPGSLEPVVDIGQARELADALGYPVLVKAAYGGGGIGIALVDNESGLEEAVNSTRRSAQASFGEGSVFLEKYVAKPRHIEVQILADQEGRTVALGERECSIQRRHQKLIEESPSPALTDDLRRDMEEAAVRVAKAMGYTNAGTVEFIFADGKFYFLEVNARLQVEHALTEMVTGLDIVKEQLRVAAGYPLSFRQEDVQPRGWAIECRINAEDPLNGFVPCPGRLEGYRSPGGIGVRVDSGVNTGYVIPPFYDPMISKLVVHARDRAEAIERMRRALYEYIIIGVRTNLVLHKAVMNNEVYRRGELTTHFLEDFHPFLAQEMSQIMAEEEEIARRLAAIFRKEKKVAAAAIAAAIYLRDRGLQA